MLHTRVTGLGLLLLLTGAAGQARADEDNSARLREMLHRTQEALRQAQSDNADLTRAKSDAEQKLKAATQQIDAAQTSSKAAQASLHSKLASAEDTQADLTKKLGDAADRLAATNTKLNETAKQLAARDAELAQVKQGLEQSKSANASCESKNLKLYSYSQELLEAYRKKGVWASLSQKDPLLGLKEVDVENLVQEYRLKMASQKIQTPAP
jgi:DNA repair exonuclease SbcCD ATPase subunit